MLGERRGLRINTLVRLFASVVCGERFDFMASVVCGESVALDDTAMSLRYANAGNATTGTCRQINRWRLLRRGSLTLAHLVIDTDNKALNDALPTCPPQDVNAS